MTSSAAATNASDPEEVARVTDRPAHPIPLGKDTRMCVVEIDCRVMATGIPGGHIVRQGVYRYRVNKYDLPVIEAQVRTERDKAEYARCIALHETLLAAYIAENVGGLGEGSTEYKLKAEEMRARYGGSPEALFHRDNLGRQLLPFESVTVVTQDLPAPVDEASTARVKEMAELVKQTNGGGNSAQDIAAVVAATIEALAAKGWGPNSQRK